MRLRPVQRISVISDVGFVSLPDDFRFQRQLADMASVGRRFFREQPLAASAVSEAFRHPCENEGRVEQTFFGSASSNCGVVSRGLAIAAESTNCCRNV